MMHDDARPRQNPMTWWFSGSKWIGFLLTNTRFLLKLREEFVTVRSIIDLP